MQVSWKELEQVLKAGQHVLLHGDPGFGKTHIASVGVDCYKCTMTEETAAAEIRGHYIPRGMNFEWHDGPGIRAWREGKRFVVDEIDRSSGDALTFFYALLDDPAVAKLTLPSGETVRPMEGFQCVATTNAKNPEVELPPGLYSRFAIRIKVDELHPDALKSLSADLRDIAKGTVTQNDDRRVDFRQWRAFDQLRMRMEPITAARAVFGERAEDLITSLKLGPRVLKDEVAESVHGDGFCDDKNCRGCQAARELCRHTVSA